MKCKEFKSILKGIWAFCSFAFGAQGERMELFKRLLALGEEYNNKNQYA
jgi:hypothetical protein